MSQLLRTDTVLLKPTQEQEKELFRLAEQSSLLWNHANYERRQAFFLFFKHKKMPGCKRQFYRFKTSQHFGAIGTGKAQPLLKKLAESWQSFWELKMMQASSRLPPHIKKVSRRGTGRTEEEKQSGQRSECSACETTATG